MARAPRWGEGYTYDAESEITAVDGGGTAAYVYDVAGERVQKAAGGVTTQYVYFGGAPIAEYNATTSGWSDYIFANGQRVVMTAESAAPADVATNGGFEQGLSGWGTWGSPTLVSDATRAHSGNDYVALSASPGNAAGVAVENLAVTPGEQLTFGGWTYLESGAGGNPGWWLAVYNASGSPIAYAGGSSPSAPPGWEYQEQTYTVPSGAATVQFYAQVWMPTSSMVLRVDDGFLSAGTFYYHSDALGSARMMTDPGGNMAWSGEFLPFGQEWNAEATVNHYKFTGQERDAETGLDYFMARHYTSQYGRFMQPDPAGMAAVDPANPQSWNRYAYVIGNPLNMTDPTGMEYCWAENPNGGGYVYQCGDDLADLNYLNQLLNMGISPFGMGIPYCNPGDSCSDNGGGGGPSPQQNTRGPQPRNCTPNPATAGQYAAATAEVATLTAEFLSGLGHGDQTFGPNTATSQVMAQSAGVQDVLNQYTMLGTSSGLYSFGFTGLEQAGANPVAQFVGSFRWSITPTNGGINLSLTNTTSFRSLTYDKGGQWQRHKFPTPMGNTHQTYSIFVPCKTS